MKLQFKHQKFQADAAKAVVDVFAGQPYLTIDQSISFGLTAAAFTRLIWKQASQAGAMNILYQS